MGLLVLQPEQTLAQAPQQIQGHYQLDLASSIGLMPATVRQKYDSLPAEVKSRAQVSMSGRTFTFTQNDSVVVAWKSRGEPMQSKGIWSFDAATSELTITAGNDQQRFAISFQQNGDLVMENKKPFGFFYRVYLRKE